MVRDKREEQREKANARGRGNRGKRRGSVKNSGGARVQKNAEAGAWRGLGKLDKGRGRI